MKFMENLKKKKANNKGFSLVELIIVIAIMAILVGIVGTQVIPYLERSREAKDLQILNSFSTAAVSAYTMNADAASKTVVVTIPKTGDATVTFDGTASSDAAVVKIATDIKTLSGYNNVPAETVWASKNGDLITSIVITIDPAAKKIEVVAQKTDGTQVLETVTSYL